MRWLIVLLPISVLLCACEDEPVFEAYQGVDDARWSRNDTKSFEFEIQDTISPYDFYLNFRHGSDYAYRNLYVFVTLNYPNGKVRVDTVECPLARPDGRWLGSGLGDLYDLRIRFWDKRSLPLTGDYSIEINQAMREEPLPSIHDVGFRIEKGFK